MPILDDTNRVDIWAEVMREISQSSQPLSVTKPQLRAAINAIDQWVEDNLASFNSAIPPAARANLTLRQKMRLLNLIIEKRFRLS